MYFLGSFVFLSLVPQPTLMRVRTHLHAVTVASTTGLFAVGYFWENLEIAGKVWNVIGIRILQWNVVKVAILQGVSADGRFAISLVVLVGVLIGFWTSTNWRPIIVVAFMFALTAFTLSRNIEQSSSDLARERSVDELVVNIGSEEVQRIGLWLISNTKTTDLVATNHIVNENGQEISDYSLAVWSERTFMVLGPRFGGHSPTKDRAVTLALRFTESPTKNTCRSLSEQGVQWFVVDLRLTKTRTWELCATTAYEYGNFVVLRLTS